MSNLCQEITLPTYPLQHIDGDGEIALCILSAINVGKVNSDKELEEMCDLTVRSLDELIDYQDYPVKAAEIESTKARRSLGVGFIGLAHYLAKLGFNYDSQEVLMLSIYFQNLSSFSYSKHLTNLLQRRVIVSILDVPSMLMEFFQLIHISQM